MLLFFGTCYCGSVLQTTRWWATGKCRQRVGMTEVDSKRESTEVTSSGSMQSYVEPLLDDNSVAKSSSVVCVMLVRYSLPYHVLDEMAGTQCSNMTLSFASCSGFSPLT